MDEQLTDRKEKNSESDHQDIHGNGRTGRIQDNIQGCRPECQLSNDPK